LFAVGIFRLEHRVPDLGQALYILGIGLGTMIGNCVFIFGGQLIADKLQNNQDIISWVIGGIFSITALIQIWKMVRKKDTAHKFEHPEEITHGLENRMEEQMEKQMEKDNK